MMIFNFRWFLKTTGWLLFAFQSLNGFAAGITGHVYDADTREPVPGAVVSILNSSHVAVADASGAYAFADLAVGNYSISARSVGLTASAPQQVKIASIGA